MARAANVKTLIASIGVALILYITYQFISLRSQNSITKVPNVDCIVVLGAAVWPGGQPSPVLRDRLSRAAELYHQGIAGKIISSGGVGKYPPAEAEVGKQFLIKAGVAETDILMEAHSSSTSEQAGRIKRICEKEGFESIALVTSFFHEKRAIQLFRRAGFTTIADARCTHERFVDLNYWVARDALGLAIINWWCWGGIGFGISLVVLTYQVIRQRQLKASVVGTDH